MNSSLKNASLPLNISGPLRYERVAQLEAVLSLRDQKSRSRVKLFATVLVIVAISATIAIL